MSNINRNPEEHSAQDAQDQLTLGFDSTPHSGNSSLPEELRESHPTGGFDNTTLRQAYEAGLINPADIVDPSTIPGSLPPTDQDANPTRQPLESSTTAENRKNWKLPAGIAAVGLLGVAGGVALSSSRGESQTPAPTESEDTNSPVTSILDTSPSETVITVEEIPEVKEQSPSVTVDEPKYIDGGNGFMLPETRTPFDWSAPEIIQTNDTDEALAQIANVLAYVTSTGDFDYLEYAYGGGLNSTLGRGAQRNYENALNARNSWGMKNFYYYKSIERDTGAPETLDPYANWGEDYVSIKEATVGFDEGDVDSPHFDHLIKMNVTLRQKDVMYEGEALKVWVISSVDEITFSEFIGYSSVITAPES